ncbi:unnamed protein product [Meloidogyne enterolobii]|uniref:Uncharacterized protein n=1 Tax=Meloidogyne enterolobii TaxID=390850 RepID=A0ACB0XZS4_MELEN
MDPIWKMTEPVPSSSKLGKPKWYFADDELTRLPSKMSLDSITNGKLQSLFRESLDNFLCLMIEAC